MVQNINVSVKTPLFLAPGSPPLKKCAAAKDMGIYLTTTYEALNQHFTIYNTTLQYTIQLYCLCVLSLV